MHIITVGMEWTNLYFKGSMIEHISIKCCISILEDCFILANSADNLSPTSGSAHDLRL